MLPAETQAWAAGASPLSCAIATRIDESRFLRNATSTVSSIVTTSVAMTSLQRGQAARRLERGGAADEQQFGLRVVVEESAAGRQGRRRAVVAAHAVDGDADRGAERRGGDGDRRLGQGGRSRGRSHALADDRSREASTLRSAVGGADGASDADCEDDARAPPSRRLRRRPWSSGPCGRDRSRSG